MQIVVWGLQFAVNVMLDLSIGLFYLELARSSILTQPQRNVKEWHDQVG